MNSRPSMQTLTVPVTWTGNLGIAAAVTETPDAAPSEDIDLLAHLQAKDSNDLDVLFDRYYGLVLGTALRVLGDASEAEEVVQEVFFYVYRKSQLFDPSKGSLKAWIIQIAFSRALDRKSYLARRRFHTGADIGSLELSGETDLEHEIEAKLSRKHLERAFTELTDDQRRTIEFFYFEGLDLREISERLREPLGRVRHHLYRGLGRLRKSGLLHRLRCK
jgi:RNA polymerase sigma-70 factor, ECF subfamily